MIFGKRKRMTTNPATRPFWVFAGSGLDVKRGYTNRNLWRITIVDKAVIYIHGKGGNAEEAIHYKPLFSNCDVIGLDYTAQFPWEAKEEFPLLFNSISLNEQIHEIAKTPL